MDSVCYYYYSLFFAKNKTRSFIDLLGRGEIAEQQCRQASLVALHGIPLKQKIIRYIC